MIDRYVRINPDFAPQILPLAAERVVLAPPEMIRANTRFKNVWIPALVSASLAVSKRPSLGRHLFQNVALDPHEPCGRENSQEQTVLLHQRTVFAHDVDRKIYFHVLLRVGTADYVLWGAHEFHDLVGRPPYIVVDKEKILRHRKLKEEIAHQLITRLGDKRIAVPAHKTARQTRIVQHISRLGH